MRTRPPAGRLPLTVDAVGSSVMLHYYAHWRNHGPPWERALPRRRGVLGEIRRVCGKVLRGHKSVDLQLTISLSGALF